MKKIAILILMIFLLGIEGSSFATSPQPEEVKPAAKETACTMHVIYGIDVEKGIGRSDTSSTFAFDASMPKKDVLDKMTGHISDKLNDQNISEFRLECKFAK